MNEAIGARKRPWWCAVGLVQSLQPALWRVHPADLMVLLCSFVPEFVLFPITYVNFALCAA